ncbi:hypothetical protein FE783_12605 [Paenibacillus mesophilus]|uniref:hypothetical protein n=1 Tax=Paenibacillus mesophilus TaxID=2582849 RepID=UPI00110ED753|nr:hypothetical protein [Paenibacillus mesophilus]TMV49350.1 hypothetical protein FE783_12605 [Paenibacillus mesophilus]
MKRKYMFEVDQTGKIARGTALIYPDEYNAEGTEEVWNNQARSFYNAQSGTWTVYDPLTLAAPTTAEVNATITATATLPNGTPDNEVSFSVSYGSESGDPVTITVADGTASQQFAFDTPGVYRITASSAHHGSASVEVTVSEPANPA